MHHYFEFQTCILLICAMNNIKFSHETIRPDGGVHEALLSGLHLGTKMTPCLRFIY